MFIELNQEQEINQKMVNQKLNTFVIEMQKEDREIAQVLPGIFASVFTVKDVNAGPTPEAFSREWVRDCL